MTVDSGYIPQGFTPNVSREYTYTFEHTGTETVVVTYQFDDETPSQVLTASEYTNEPGPVSGDDLFDGGLVTISAFPPSNVSSIVISRSTPITQLVDYQPYTPFPAETTEFTIDKLTLILQEINWLVAIGGTGGGGGGGAFVPLAGTVGGQPITGPFQFNSASGFSWAQSQGNLFGLNYMAFNADTAPAALGVTTLNDLAEQHTFTFTQDGQFYLPSFGAANNEVWVFQGSDFLGTENTLAVYSFDQNTGLRTENPIILYTSGTQAFSFTIDGKIIQTGVVGAGDNDQVIATKLYVDDAIIGGGNLPSVTDGQVLIGVNTAWAKAQHFLISETVFPGTAYVSMTGTIQFENIDTPANGQGAITAGDNLAGGTNLILFGNSVNDGLLIAPEGIGAPNEFGFGNGFLALPKEATADSHATTKKYVDDAITATGGLPTGTINQTLRHNGSGWEATSLVTVSGGGEITAGSVVSNAGVSAVGTVVGGTLSASNLGNGNVNSVFGGLVNADPPLAAMLQTIQELTARIEVLENA
jgi:hypothetical protein